MNSGIDLSIDQFTIDRYLHYDVTQYMDSANSMSTLQG